MEPRRANRSPPPRPSLKARLQRRLSAARRIAVLAVGSSLRGDDAAGLLTAQKLTGILRTSPLKSAMEIEVFVAETTPENLTGAIKRFQPTHLLVLDAVDLGAAPGHTDIVDPSAIAAGGAASTHSLSLKLLLDYLRDALACEVTVIGIQPQSLAFDTPCSKPVRRAARRIAAAIAAAVHAGLVTDQ